MTNTPDSGNELLSELVSRVKQLGDDFIALTARVTKLEERFGGGGGDDEVKRLLGELKQRVDVKFIDLDQTMLKIAKAEVAEQLGQEGEFGVQRTD